FSESGLYSGDDNVTDTVSKRACGGKVATARLSIEVRIPLVVGPKRRKMVGPWPGIFINRLSNLCRLSVTLLSKVDKRSQSVNATDNFLKSFFGIRTQPGNQSQYSKLTSDLLRGEETIWC